MKASYFDGSLIQYEPVLGTWPYHANTVPFGWAIAATTSQFGIISTFAFSPD